MTGRRRKPRIGVVGLGYVGLPLAVEFGKHYETIGFDVNPKRVAQLCRGRDLTLEATPAELKAAQLLTFTTELNRLRRCQVFVDELYASIVTAGTHKSSSIRVAEAAKVIENTQRDVNIALINELALIFNRLEIDTEEVLNAAGSKWNFLPFRPGLVGGHCIGVDPYYLTHKAQEIGYHPEMI